MGHAIELGYMILILSLISPFKDNLVIATLSSRADTGFRKVLKRVVFACTHDVFSLFIKFRGPPKGRGVGSRPPRPPPPPPPLDPPLLFSRLISRQSWLPRLPFPDGVAPFAGIAPVLSYNIIQKNYFLFWAYWSVWPWVTLAKVG